MPFSILRLPVASADAEAIFCPSSSASPLRKLILRLDGQPEESAAVPFWKRSSGGPVTTGGNRLCRVLVHIPFPEAENASGIPASYSEILHAALRLLESQEVRSTAIPLEKAFLLHETLKAVQDFLLHEDEGDLDIRILLPADEPDEPYVRMDRIASQEFSAPSPARKKSMLPVRPSMRPLGGMPPSVQVSHRPVTDNAPPPSPSAPARFTEARPAEEAEIQSLLRDLRSMKEESESFHDMLFRLIDETCQPDAQIYRKANISRQLFSKIRSNRRYQPGKNTVFALAFALHLTEEETSLLLASAGFSFSPSSPTDRAVRLCMQRDIYDIADVNELLFQLDLKGLGG